MADDDFTYEGTEKYIQDLIDRKNLQLDLSHAMGEATSIRDRHAGQRLPPAPIPVTRSIMGVLRQPGGQLLTWENSATEARKRWPPHLLAVRRLVTYILQRPVASYRPGSKGSQIPIPSLAQGLARERMRSGGGQRAVTATLAAGASASQVTPPGAQPDPASPLEPDLDPNLPAGWTEAADPSTGHPYYFNVALGVTQWERPDAGAHRSRSPYQRRRPSRWDEPREAAPAAELAPDSAGMRGTDVHDRAIRLHEATTTTIRTCAQEFITICGSGEACTAALQAAAVLLAAQNRPTAAGATLGLAFVLAGGQAGPPHLEKFAECGGNMYRYYQENPSAFGLFLATHPAAAQALPMWCQMSSEAPSTAAAPVIAKSGGPPAPAAQAASGSLWGGAGLCGHAQAARVDELGPVRQRPRTPPQMRKVEGWLETDFADLRAKHPPIDPKALVDNMAFMAQRPCSPPGTPILKFIPPEGADLRESKWLWWGALARVGFFVKEMYTYTEYAASVNASAGVGTPGQEVVRTPLGTLIWMRRDRRIATPGGGADLMGRLSLGFPAYNVVEDMKGFHRGRIPKQLAEVLGPQS